MSPCWMKKAHREQLWSVESHAQTQQWEGTTEMASIQPTQPSLSFPLTRLYCACVWYVVCVWFMYLLG